MGVPYYAHTAVVLYAEMSFASGSGFGVWDESSWGSGTWGPDETWTDVSAYLRLAPPIQIRRGFSRDLAGWQAGTCSFTLANVDGRFSPTNLSGPYVSAGVSEIRPWRPVRIYATYGGTTYPLFRGYALSFAEGWDKSGDATVTVSCVDEMGSLARFDGAEQPAVGAGETSGRRIHRILDNAGHTGSRSIDTGEFTMQATTLAQNAATELKLTADSEGGYLWIDADGTVVFGSQLALFEGRSLTSQATYADDRVGLPYHDLVVSYDGDRLANVVAFARAGGTQQTATDNDSRALYGDKRYGRSDLVCETDSDVMALATRHVFLYSAPELRFDAMTVKPARNPAVLFPEVLGRRILDRVTVKRTPPAGDPISRDVHIAGVTHTIGSEWITTFMFSSAEMFTAGNGTWNSAVWGVSQWSA